jgi:hypothetical protein
MANQRFSLVKELRIKQLADQGYNYSSIAAICNLKTKGSVAFVIKRARRHWLYPDDPWKGRVRNFLSDNQVEDIRLRAKRGEHYQSIADDHKISYDCVYKIAVGRSYKSDETGFPFDFEPKRARHLL